VTKFWKYFLFFNKIYVINNTSLVLRNTFLMIVYKKKIRIILLFVNVFILSNTTVQSCFSFAEHRLFMTMRCQNHFQTTTKKTVKIFVAQCKTIYCFIGFRSLIFERENLSTLLCTLRWFPYKIFLNRIIKCKVCQIRLITRSNKHLLFDLW
jgi:hypothetical protein